MQKLGVCTVKFCVPATCVCVCVCVCVLCVLYAYHKTFSLHRYTRIFESGGDYVVREYLEGVREPYETTPN